MLPIWCNSQAHGIRSRIFSYNYIHICTVHGLGLSVWLKLHSDIFNSIQFGFNTILHLKYWFRMSRAIVSMQPIIIGFFNVSIQQKKSIWISTCQLPWGYWFMRRNGVQYSVGLKTSECFSSKNRKQKWFHQNKLLSQINRLFVMMAE